MYDFINHEPGAVAFFVIGMRKGSLKSELLAVMPTRESADSYRFSFMDTGLGCFKKSGYDYVTVARAVRLGDGVARECSCPSGWDISTGFHNGDVCPL